MVPESPSVFPIVGKRITCSRESLQTVLLQSPAGKHQTFALQISTRGYQTFTPNRWTLHTEDTLLSTDWKDEGPEDRADSETSKCNAESLG